jgi:nicotinamide phosphoribosyltransferase
MASTGVLVLNCYWSTLGVAESQKTGKEVPMTNMILNSDSYKFSHFLQYPPGTTEVSAYIEARKGGRWPETTFFGLQAFLQEYLSQPIRKADIEEAREITEAHIPGLGFNDQWEYILEKYNGELPIEIQALPEGMSVPLGVPMVQVRNLDKNLPWLSTFIETALIRAVWYPSTVATLSREAKKIIYAGLKKSSDDPDGQIPFKLHDFGARGVSSYESAGLGGMAHLINFMGTDTVTGLQFARKYYGPGDLMAGFSIPAAEHSTITSWGPSGEKAAYENMLHKFGGKGRLVAVVSDSYDVHEAVRRIWGEELKSKVISMGGTTVIRPDSGDPIRVPVQVLQLLDNAFGSDKNSRGFKVLNGAVRVIQGDGMNLDSIGALVRNVIDAGFSMDNLAMGMGGGLLQSVNRDTQRFAMKANEIVICGDRLPVSKNPNTDPSKNSKPGRQAVVTDRNGNIESIPESLAAGRENLLRPVWRTGEFLVREDFATIRERAKL